jgi:hypothetical protein
MGEICLGYDWDMTEIWFVGDTNHGADACEMLAGGEQIAVTSRRLATGRRNLSGF